MNKGISTVIATVLILMITITLTGTAYLYISGTFTGKLSTTFELIDAFNDTVTIRNGGTNPITKITATSDNNPVNIAITPQIQGLVAYLSTNEGSGATITDSSDNKNIGTLGPACPDCPSWTVGQYGNALQFDGVNDVVTGNLPNNAINLQGTVSAYVNFNVVSGSDAPIVAAKSGGNWFGIASYYNNIAGEIYGSSDGASCGGATVLCSALPGQSCGLAGYVSKWVHIVMTFDNSIHEAKFYVNGIQVGRQAWYMCNIGSSQTFQIGGRISVYTNGIIDEASIYNRALNESEVKQLYSGLVTAGQLATIKPLTALTKGTHTLKLCTSSMCNTAILRIN